jgi:hypothetical protein
MGMRARRGLLRFVVALAACLACLLLAGRAGAQQQFLNQLGRAGTEFFAAGCANGCNTTVCGHKLTYSGGNNGQINVPDLGINNLTVGTAGAAANNAIAVANALNVYCGSTAGDTLLATGGSLHMQSAQVEGVGRTLGTAGRGPASGSVTGAGGTGEISSTTYGASIPLDYGYRISHDRAISAVGFVNFAHQGNANQGGITASPAYAWAIDNDQGQRVLGIAAYVPLSFAMAQVDNVPNGTLISWGAGGGALASGSLHVKSTDITIGGSVAGRMTAAGFSLPLSVLLRADQPLEFTSKVRAFTSLSYGNDFLNAGSEIWTLALGAAVGKYEFGYRGFYGNAYVAHTIGFAIRSDLEDILEPLQEEKKEPYPPVNPQPSPAPPPPPPPPPPPVAPPPEPPPATAPEGTPPPQPTPAPTDIPVQPPPAPVPTVPPSDVPIIPPD